MEDLQHPHPVHGHAHGPCIVRHDEPPILSPLNDLVCGAVVNGRMCGLVLDKNIALRRHITAHKDEIGTQGLRAARRARASIAEKAWVEKTMNAYVKSGDYARSVLSTKATARKHEAPPPRLRPIFEKYEGRAAKDPVFAAQFGSSFRLRFLYDDYDSSDADAFIQKITDAQGSCGSSRVVGEAPGQIELATANTEIPRNACSRKRKDVQVKAEDSSSSFCSFSSSDDDDDDDDVDRRVNVLLRSLHK
ncbi:hypothetical protein LTR04_004164 [Oleoguttula sp. CCFEE 6159]|nr:hypothetical protein LTR04_004164 [Oleoguttula sp. CCFEE 6159]